MCPRYNSTLEQLPRLLAGDLSPVAAWRLRRHLNACAECAADAESVRALFRVAAGNASTQEPDAELGARTWTRISAPGATRPVAPPPGRRVLPRRVIVSAAALAGAGTLAVAFSLLPGTPIQPTVAFAQVEKALESVRTASWIETTIQYRGTGDAEEPQSMQVWVSTAPPRLIHLALPDARGMRRGYDSILTERMTVGRVVPDGMYSVDVHKPSQLSVEKWTRRLLRNAILFPRDPSQAGTEDVSTGFRNVRAKPWKMERTVLNGRPVLRFQRTLGAYEPDGAYPFTETVFAEPDTYRVVRKELLATNPKTGKPRWRSYAEGYQYDKPAPATVDEIMPPVGKPVQLWFHGADSKVPLSTRQRFRPLIDQAGDAWRRRNWKAFDAVTNFSAYVRSTDMNFDGGAQQERYFRGRFDRQEPVAGWSVDRLVMTYRSGMPYIYVRKSATDPFPPEHQLAPDYEVIVVLKAMPRDGGRPVLRAANFTIHEAEDGELTITHIDFAPILPESIRAKLLSGTAPRPEGRR
jgi:hypothetical protein